MIDVQGCPLINLFNTISKMWVLHILRSIFFGNESFSDIQQSLGTISSKILSARLKELQIEGFINRQIISVQPVKIKYSLTEKGMVFSKEMEKLSTWAKDNGY